MPQRSDCVPSPREEGQSFILRDEQKIKQGVLLHPKSLAGINQARKNSGEPFFSLQGSEILNSFEFLTNRKFCDIRGW